MRALDSMVGLLTAGRIFVLFVAMTGAALSGETWREPFTGMEFVQVGKGCFKMGVPKGTFKDENLDLAKRAETESPEHEVCLDTFWVARHEMTEAQREMILTARTVVHSSSGPAVGVDWVEANALARRLTELSSARHDSLSVFRLPTEAEWEYLCRAGGAPVLAVPYSDELRDYAWFSTPPEPDSDRRIAIVQPVGGKKPNAWGLHDTRGNAWEWVQDTYAADSYAQHALFNPVAVGLGDRKVIRGGSIRTDRRLVRCETRAWLPESGKQDNVGVRLVRTTKAAP